MVLVFHFENAKTARPGGPCFPPRARKDRAPLKPRFCWNRRFGLSLLIYTISKDGLEALHGKKQGVEKNREIEKDPAILDVVQVILNGFMDDEPAVAAELPEAGQTLGNREPAAFERGVGVCYIGHLRTRPDQRHVSGQNVEQLRKLIQTGFSQKPSRRRNALVFRAFGRAPIFWSVHIHAAEFEHNERVCRIGRSAAGGRKPVLGKSL